jgi:hypothetical protein
MKHLHYATQQGVPLGSEERNASSSDSKKYRLVATDGIYTANIIFDLTEGTDEKRAWKNVVRRLLNNYEGFISREGLPCDELDRQFETFAKTHLGKQGLCKLSAVAILGV